MQLHASCVALNGRGVLIRGRSGSGKSALALELMALGAVLVADDRTDITAGPDGPVATCPQAIRGMIEARGVGLLQAETETDAPVTLVVDMDTEETHRLPPHRVTDLAGAVVPLVHKSASIGFAAALRQYLIGGRIVTE